MPDRALILVRQSLTRRDSVSLEAQEAAASVYCDNHGYGVIAVLKEPSTRGWWDEREMIAEIYARAERRAFDVLITWDLSRVARSVRQVENLIYDLGKRHARYESINEAWVANPLVRQIIAAAAEEQTRTIARNVASAIRTKAATGIHHGAIPYGYARGEDRRLTPLAKEANIIREIYQRYADGEGIAEIRRWLATDPTVPPRRQGGHWSVGVVWDILHSETYRGVVTIAAVPTGPTKFDGLTIVGAHEAIIDPDLAERLRRRLGDGRPAARQDKQQTHWLEGHVWCRCGEPMYYVSRRSRTSGMWECRAMNLWYNGVREAPCPESTPRAGERWVERGTIALWGATLARAGTVDDSQLRRLVDKPDKRSTAAQAELLALKRQQDNLIEAIKHGAPPSTMGPELATIAARIAQAERVAAAFAPSRTLDDLRLARALAADLAGSLAVLSDRQLRAQAERMGLRVMVAPEERRVTLSFGEGFGWLGEPTRAGKRAQRVRERRGE